MNLIDVWVVYEGGDDRHCGSPKYFYTSEKVAINKAHKQGWWGSDAEVKKRQAILIDGKYFLIDIRGEIDLNQEKEKTKAELREQAKAKLTSEEWEALGLNDAVKAKSK